MPRGHFFSGTLPLTWRKLRASKAVFAVFAGFPPALALFWARGSFEAARDLFLVLIPHLFLIATQDLVGGEVDGGALENPLFLEGRFRKYLGGKTFAVALIVSGYALGVFSVLAVIGGPSGGFEAGHLRKFVIALIAGWYYAALGGFLSHFFRSGSNVVVVILGQAVLLMTLILSGSFGRGVMGFLESGRFPDRASAVRFGLFVAAFPNAAVSGKAQSFVPEILAGFAVLVLLQKWRAGRLELRRGGSGGC